MMRLVTLQGTSKKGRERVTQHGAVWVVEGAVGTRLFLKSWKGHPHGDARWVWSEGDLNFTVREGPEGGSESQI